MGLANFTEKLYRKKQDSRLEKIYSLINTENYSEAYELFETNNLDKYTYRSAESYYLLGLCLEKLNDKASAHEMYKKAMNKQGEDEYSENARAAYERLREHFDGLKNTIPNIPYQFTVRDIGVCINLAQLCYNGSSSAPPDKPAALRWYLRAAEAGSIDAQYKAAVMYYDGDGIPADKGEALRWFLKAAESGNVDAQFYAGTMYYKGEGTDVNMPEALKWYQKSAKRFHTAAQYNVGLMYYKGIGTAADKEMAFRWFQRVLVRENFDIQSAEHYNGEYLPEYITMHLLKKAADQDNQAAIYILMNI